MINRIFISVLFSILLINGITEAAVETFEGQGEYVMENNESIRQAQDVAMQEAMRGISQQATAVISGSSGSSDNQLTKDEVEMVTAAIMNVNEKRFEKTLSKDNKIKVVAYVKAEIDVDRAEKMARELMAAKKSSQEIEKIKAVYTSKQNEYSTLQGQYSTLSKGGGVKHRVREALKLERDGKITEALRIYDETIATDPTYARAYSHRGHIYRQQGKIDLARKDYEKAFSLDDKEAGAHYGRAILLERDGKRSEAAKEYRLFIKYSDILEYDKEIPGAIEKIIKLEGM